MVCLVISYCAVHFSCEYIHVLVQGSNAGSLAQKSHRMSLQTIVAWWRGVTHGSTAHAIFLPTCLLGLAYFCCRCCLLHLPDTRLLFSLLSLSSLMALDFDVGCITQEWVQGSCEETSAPRSHCVGARRRRIRSSQGSRR